MDESHWQEDVPLDVEFQKASERFGGALDLRPADSDPRVATPQRLEARANTRLLFLRPLNIFRHILRKLAQRPALRGTIIGDIKFGYLLTTMPNALCWKDGGRYYYIGVTSGLGYLVHGWAASFLSMPDFMPDAIAGAEDEIPGDLRLLRQGFDLEKVIDWKREEGLIQGKYRMPKSPARRLVTYEIAHMALLHTFLHELGHCLLRHLDFAGDYLDVHMLKELRSGVDGRPEKEHLAHFFELTADNLAMEVFLAERGGQQYGGGPADGYACWSLAVDLVLWLFGYGTALTEASPTHPHPHVRIANKVHKLAEYEKHNSGRIVCQLGPDVKLPIDKFCNWVSRQLAESWIKTQLPGWTNSLWSGKEALGVSHKKWCDVWQTNSALRRAYEEHIDWKVVAGAIAGNSQ